MKKILLFDDNPLDYDDYIDALRTQYEVTVVHDIESATHRMKIMSFDLLIIDQMMPTDGVNKKDQFRTGLNFYIQYVAENYSNIPVVFWTHLSDKMYNEFWEKYSKPSKIMYLKKQGGGELFLAKINEFLK
jgi:CheY-like chemotaxis protein